MKAVQINSYGKPDVIAVNPEASAPTLTPDHVIVKVYAASINAIDWKLSLGNLSKNVPLQFPVTLGGDFAGVITEGVTGFAKGEEVYGSAIILGGGSGAMAEYASAPIKAIAKKPVHASWEEAAALPLVGVSALQALTEHMDLKSGQRILIHGGAGGIGSTAIQLAKSLGAYVVTTCGTRDVDFVKGLGADEVIDYKTQQFENLVKDMDGVYDTVGGETAEKSLGVLKKGGILVSMLGQTNPEKAQELGVTSIGQQTRITTERLDKLSELVDSGKIKIQVDKVYSLEQARDAFVYQEDIHPRGKVVIKVL